MIKLHNTMYTAIKYTMLFLENVPGWTYIYLHTIHDAAVLNT